MSYIYLSIIYLSIFIYVEPPRHIDFTKILELRILTSRMNSHPQK